MRDVFIGKLMELAENDPRLLLITGDLGFGVFDEFLEKYPDRFLNAGVAEQNMTGMATGIAMEGRIVFTYSIGNFPVFRCLEQIRNDACYHMANVKIVSIGGGFSYGSLGISHHATEDLAVMRSLPNMTIVSPGDLWETQNATEALINTEGPCYFRLDKSHACSTGRAGEVFQIGKARRLIDGNELTLMAIGGILGVVLKAAEKLEKEGIKCRVVSMHTLKPLDEDEIFDAVQNTGGIITIEEHTINGGLGGAVAELCLENGRIPQCFKRIGLQDKFSSLVGDQEFLRKNYEMDDAYIIFTVKHLLGKTGKR
jgi:transketolase